MPLVSATTDLESAAQGKRADLKARRIIILNMASLLLYSSVRLGLPDVSRVAPEKEKVEVAVLPEPLSAVPAPTSLPLSKNSTVPVGVPPVALVLVTVAVKVRL